MGIFTDWQPRYARHGVPTFPVTVGANAKRPLVKSYLETDGGRSAGFLRKFGDAKSFGFACGPRSGLTIVDLDSTDDAIVAEGAKLFGQSPLVWRTGGGKFAS